MSGVTAGSNVTVKLNGEEKLFTIVEPDQTDPSKGHISFNSPIAQAIIGGDIGDVAHVLLPNGNEIGLELISVS